MCLYKYIIRFLRSKTWFFVALSHLVIAPICKEGMPPTEAHHHKHSGFRVDWRRRQAPTRFPPMRLLCGDPYALRLRYVTI